MFLPEFRRFSLFLRSRRGKPAALNPPEAKRKRDTFPHPRSLFRARLLSASCREAFAAINRLVGRGLEGNLARLTAVGADGVEHFSGFTSGVLSLRTAFLALLGLVLELLFGIERLLARREHELIAAFLAY